jgi:aspartate/methionine/tyrosine aminotransferase
MNPRIAEVAPSLIRSISARKRPDDIDLGLGEPTIPPAIEAFEVALEWTRRNGSPYSPNAGFSDLRAVIAAYLALDGWASSGPGADNVCVTVGSEEALYLAIKTIVDPARDEVLIVEPCYLAYPKICVLEGIRHRMVPLLAGEDFRPRAEAILEALRPETRLVVLNTPSNPTGRIWPAEELAALAARLDTERPDVYLLADEVYRELYFTDTRPASVARFHGRTLVAGSLSKSNSLTGLRLGWLAGPADVIGQATKVHQFINTAASTFAQRVAIELLSEPARLAANRPHYVAARERLLAAATRNGLELIPPEGAFYALMRLPAGAPASLEIAERLLDDRRVVTVPGRAFGESGEGFLRLSWVAPVDRLEEGVGRIAAWLEDQVAEAGV